MNAQQGAFLHWQTHLHRRRELCCRSSATTGARRLRAAHELRECMSFLSQRARLSQSLPWRVLTLNDLVVAVLASIGPTLSAAAVSAMLPRLFTPFN